MLALALAIVAALSAAPPKRPAEPQEARTWEARIRKVYEPTSIPSSTFEPQSKLIAGPTCPKGRAEAFRIGFAPWALKVELAPKNPRSFSKLRVVVRKLAPGVDGYTTYRSAMARGCRLDKSGEALFQTGGYWISVQGTCGSKELFPYEVADFLKVFNEPGAAAPAELIYAACSVPPKFMTLKEAKAEGARERNVGGVQLPGARRPDKPGAQKPGKP